MRALVTGASSGIGRDMAKYLNELGYDLIITARREDKLKELKEELDKNKKGITEIIIADLSDKDECKRLYREVKEKYSEGIDFLINNAGFGLYGRFADTDLNTETDMIDTNIIAVQILTKLFIRDMVEKNSGNILNVASIAGFMPGPLMATYYATKSYVLRLSRAIKVELKKNKSKVKISTLCPGPTETSFFDVAKVKFNFIKGASCEKVAKYGIDKALKGKFMIVPGFINKLIRVFSKITPESIAANACYYVQGNRK